VIDLRTLLPLDEETILQSVRKTNKCWWCMKTPRPAESPAKSRPFSAKKAFGDLDGPLMRVTSLDTPVPYAPTAGRVFSAQREKDFSAAKELARY